MSVLNLPSDGLFNVLIVLTRASVRLGAKNRDELLKACGADLLVDPKQLNQTLNRWIELGFEAAAQVRALILHRFPETLVILRGKYDFANDLGKAGLARQPVQRTKPARG